MPVASLHPAADHPDPAGRQLPGTVQDFVINAGDRVYFDYDKFDVRADAAPVLDAWGGLTAGRYSAVHVRIEGNADERGPREFPQPWARAGPSVPNLSPRGVGVGSIDGGEAGGHRNGHTTITGGAQ